MKSFHTKSKVQNKSIFYTLFVSVVIGLIITMILLWFLTNNILNGNIDITKTGSYLNMITVITILISGMIALSICTHNRIVVLSLVLLTNIILRLGLGICAFDGTFQKLGIKLVAMVIGCVAALIINLIFKKNKKAVRHF